MEHTHHEEGVFSRNSPTTSLDWLFQYKMITEEMYEAGIRYAEICHSKPVGGPGGAKSSLSLREGMSLCSKDDEFLWREMSEVLQRSPIRRLMILLIEEDNLKVLDQVFHNPPLRTLVRSTLYEMSLCLRE